MKQILIFLCSGWGTINVITWWWKNNQ